MCCGPSIAPCQASSPRSSSEEISTLLSSIILKSVILHPSTIQARGKGMWFNGGPPGPPHHGPPPPGHPLHGLPHPAYPPGHPLHLPPGVQMMPMGGPHTVMPGMPMGAMPPLPPMTPMGQMQQNGGPSGSHQMMGPSTSGPPPSQPRGRPAHRDNEIFV
ncbi:hypothetical protein GCK72_024977 [Caenorhabditis remanei]|uniref:Uncharacterized protein n=1 Tax=Caenorhabditis remanei TaxID=31234 RepID=A0A6A5G0P0_CAERE|nr:hypothetical protein GCK72_024977 [Caenorhabditis remanei]KAF1748510.1 hypothetical protein GCK72_024977 [Caenorhabditis remanei]